jgi:hypothetical protein
MYILFLPRVGLYVTATEKMQRQTNKYNRKSQNYGGENMHFFFYDSSKINTWFGF